MVVRVVKHACRPKDVGVFKTRHRFQKGPLLFFPAGSAIHTLLTNRAETELPIGIANWAVGLRGGSEISVLKYHRQCHITFV